MTVLRLLWQRHFPVWRTINGLRFTASQQQQGDAAPGVLLSLLQRDHLKSYDAKVSVVAVC